MKLLLDTNALIDLVAPREPYASAVRRLCVASSFGDVQLWVSTQSYADAYYVLRKAAPEREVKQALLATLEFFLPCGTQAADLRPALESDWHDLEDYLVAHSTKAVGARFMVTRDSEMASKCPVRALTASEMLEHLETEHGLTYGEVRL